MVQSILRPGNGQRIVYNGHKRVYELQFQSITLPNELIGNIFGLGGKYFNRIWNVKFKTAFKTAMIMAYLRIWNPDT